MILTIPNTNGTPAFQIRPHNSECWELWEYRTVEEKEGGVKTGRTGYKWVSMGKYPTRLSHAFLNLYEHVLKRSDLDITGFEECMEAVKQAERRVKDAQRDE